MKKILLVATVVAFSFLSSAQAEEKTQEIGINGFITSQISPSGGSDSVFVVGHYGRYFKPQILGTINVMNLSIGSNNTTVGAGVGGKYYFRVGQKGDLVPFVDADVMVMSVKSGSTTTNPFQISAGGGASYFLTETASVDAHAGLQFQSASGTNITLFNVTVGLTQRF